MTAVTTLRSRCCGVTNWRTVLTFAPALRAGSSRVSTFKALVSPETDAVC